MAIIKDNVDKFQNIVDGLDNGISLCAMEISSNKKTIQDLSNKNATIGDSKTQAEAFKGNLESMLKVPKKEKKKDK